MHWLGDVDINLQQLAAPMAIRPLLPQQILLRAGDGLRNLRIDR
jgi:hypothetical protein